MTEQEWLTCTDPTPMLEFLRDKASDRKLRLFGIACCRRLWHLLDDEHGHPALELAERCAEGEKSARDLWNWWNQHEPSSHDDLYEQIAHGIGVTSEAINAAFVSVRLMMGMTGWKQVTSATEMAVTTVAILGLGSRADDFSDDAEEEFDEAARPFAAPEKVAQAMLFRDIVGNPFRPVIINRSWLTSTVNALAEGIYAERAFDRMPILADALQDAGCDSADILGHCRSDGPHVRACWVIDLLLGKE